MSQKSDIDELGLVTVNARTSDSYDSLLTISDARNEIAISSETSNPDSNDHRFLELNTKDPELVEPHNSDPRSARHDTANTTLNRMTLDR